MKLAKYMAEWRQPSRFRSSDFENLRSAVNTNRHKEQACRQQYPGASRLRADGEQHQWERAGSMTRFRGCQAATLKDDGINYRLASNWGSCLARSPAAGLLLDREPACSLVSRPRVLHIP